MIRHLRRAARPHEHISHRRAWAGVITFVVLSAVAGVVIITRATAMAKEFFGTYASVAVTEASQGVYHLSVGKISMNWLRQSITLESVRLQTNSAANRLRRAPLPDTRIALGECRVSDIGLLRLVAGRGLYAGSFGCRTVAVDATVLARAPDSARIVQVQAGPMRERPARGGFLVLQKKLTLPRTIPRVVLREINFPHSRFNFRLERLGRDAMTMSLADLRWSIQDMKIDPADTAAWQRPLFSRSVLLSAMNFVARPSSHRIVRVGRLQASLTDSLIEVRDVAYQPVPGHPSSIAVAAGRIATAGLDVGTFANGEGVETRLLEVDSLQLTVTDVKRGGARRPPRQHDTPQQWIASELGNLAVDTARINGNFTLRELHPGHARAGVLTFNDLEITAANVRHVVGRQTTDDVMSLELKARLQNAGLLQARFEIPLDAPRFDMRYRGSLGAMDATTLNRFLEPAADVRITSGRVTRGITFDVTVRNGVARGTITPLYDQLRIKVLRDPGSGGILGSRGTLGAAVRRVASFFANERIVRDDNPDEADDPVRVGRIYRIRQPTEKLPSFLWSTLKEGLFDVIKK